MSIALNYCLQLHYQKQIRFDSIQLLLSRANKILTKVCRIVIVGTLESKFLQMWHQVGNGTLVDTVSRCKDVQVIKHLEDQRRRLVYRAHDRTSIHGQHLQQRHAVRARGTVQTSVQTRQHKIGCCCLLCGVALHTSSLVTMIPTSVSTLVPGKH